jgi:hypothetical protein
MATILDRTLDAEQARLQDAGMLRRLQLLGREAAAIRTAAAEPIARPSVVADAPSATRPARLHRLADRPPRLRVLGPETPAP